LSIHVYGIRHHGPGCARSLRAALTGYAPDIVLVEGPPDAQEVLPLLAHEGMAPPVALLVYDPAAPRRAAFYPFAVFSPEWQALRYALDRGVPARFMDLPQAVHLALDEESSPTNRPSPPPHADWSPGSAEPTAQPALPCAGEGGRPTYEDDARSSAAAGAAPPHDDGNREARGPTGASPSPAHRERGLGGEGSFLRDDPIGALAEAAGYDDHELWWEQQIEQRQDAAGLFEGILEAMTAVRAAMEVEPGGPSELDEGAAPDELDEGAAPDEPGGTKGARRDVEALREAHMRQAIRSARREDFARIAVVCGAWHAPVLVEEAVTDRARAKTDAALLSKLPRSKVAATWIPWTNSRLSYRSGYGAGVRSPGWYEHLWAAPDRHAMRWLARVAHLLRAEDLDASPASVVEAVRLAEALAAMRGLPMPGLAELHEASQTILCAGAAAPMALIRDKLEVGERLGEVPAETPAVPLQADLAAELRRLRLKSSAEERALDLDLRDETDRARSHLLHRLALLDIPWGHAQTVGGKSGTFHELWRLQWQPALAVAVIEAALWGNTVEAAATARARRQGEEAADLPRLTALLDAAILAALPDAVPYLLDLVRRGAAVASDVRRLMEALPPLARVARYGDVRGTVGAQVISVIDALFERIVVGLPGACSALDDDAATEIAAGMGHVRESVALLDRAGQRDEWHGVLGALVERDGVHGLVRGWSCRLLLEGGRLDAAELRRLARLALSPVTGAAAAAAWLEGVLRGGGFLLLQQDGLWAALDGWLRDLAPETFVEMLPLVRRAFAAFQPAERRTMGQKVKHLGNRQAEAATTASADRDDIDRERADLVLPVLASILGVAYEGAAKIVEA